MSKENTGGQNYQDSPHKEGAYGNTAYQKPSGQNISHSISEMNEESEEQLRGREKNKNDESGQQESNNNSL